MQITKIADKRQYLREKGVDEDIINYAMSLSPKHAVWLAREFSTFFERNMSISDLYEDETSDIRAFYPPKIMKRVIMWADDIKPPNIMNITLAEAITQSETWLEEQQLQKTYEIGKTDRKTIYNLPNGYFIAQLETGSEAVDDYSDGVPGGGYLVEIGEDEEKAHGVEPGYSNVFALINNSNEIRAFILLELGLGVSNKETNNKPSIMVLNIQSVNGEDATIPLEEKQLIKTWLDFVSKKFSLSAQPFEYDQERFEVESLLETNDYSEYGVPANLYGIGGDEDTYYDNLKDAYSQGWAGAYFYKETATKLIDAIINYASKRNELNELENAQQQFETWAWEMWIDYEYQIELENQKPEEPDKDDFILPQDINQEQLELGGEKTPLINEEAFSEAWKEYDKKYEVYEKEVLEHQEYYEPYIISNYIYNKVQKVKDNLTKEENNIEEEKVAKMKTKVYKMSQSVKEEDIPRPEILATYIEALKTYLEDASISKELAEQIENLPAPSQVKKNYSFQECKLLFETVNYLWKAIVKKDIVDESKIQEAPEQLMGNYWMLKNGVLLRGPNHISIIKQNTSMFCSLLNLNAFTLLQYLSDDPNKLIFYVIRNGGMRIFINKNKEAYFQMSEEIYAKWGRKKIKELDLPKKIVKVLNYNGEYNGWNSGIVIKL